jgi:hypothetical protein
MIHRNSKQIQRVQERKFYAGPLYRKIGWCVVVFFLQMRNNERQIHILNTWQSYHYVYTTAFKSNIRESLWSWSYGFTLPMQSVPIPTKVVSSNPVHGEVYSIQYYVIMFVSVLWKVGWFLRVLWFPPPIKLIDTIYLKYCWKGRKTPKP